MSLFYRRFIENTERWPDRVTVEMQRRDHLESYSFRELRHMGESVGNWLAQQNVTPGSRCAIFADNSPTWLACYIGVLGHGCTAVPLDNNYHADQVKKLLADSGAIVLFTDTRHLAESRESITGGNARLVVIDGDAVPGTPHISEIFSAGPGNFTPAPVTESTLATLLYTSGTTADPKGVMLSHGNFAAEVNAISAFVRINDQDAILGILPLFHSLAQVANLQLPLSIGARIVYLETLNTTELLRGLRERKISAFCVVPQFFYLIHERIFKEVAKRGAVTQKLFAAMLGLNRLLRRFGLNAGKILFRKVHDTIGPSMRILVTGGSRFEPQVARDFYALGIDILQAFGLTETTGGAVATPPDDNVIGSVGKPLPTVEVRILDPQPQEDGPSVGEIAIRGPIVMQGYYNRPDATAATIQNGWLLSGDLGYFDSSGNLFITGRKKELIVLANGKNLYPEEIEAHYLKSAFVKEICVMSLQAVPGDPSSERLHAVIVPNLETMRERKVVNMREAIRWDLEGLSQQLASMKRILSYDIWQEDLPRTTTRKIKRFEVEKRVKEQKARGGSAGEATAAKKELTADEQQWMEQPQVQRALQIIKEFARNSGEPIRPGDNLELDLGLDSMQRIELLVSIEGEVGGKVEESELGHIYTVRQLVDAVLASAAEGKGTGRTQFAGWAAVLSEDPTDPEVLALTKPHPMAPFWFMVGRIILLVSRDLFDLEVSGLEKIPEKGPFILSSNHQAYLDPVILGAVLPWKHFKNLFSVGTSEIFGGGIMRWLARQLRIMVVDPDANLVPAMKGGAYGLRHGLPLILYPEGERSIDGTPKVFKKGAAILAIHLQVPVIPIAITGFYESWPRGKSFQGRFPWRMKFGDPILPPEGEPSEKVYAQMTAEIKTRVVEMWDELNGKSAKPLGSDAQAAD